MFNEIKMKGKLIMIEIKKETQERVRQSDSLTWRLRESKKRIDEIFSAQRPIRPITDIEFDRWNDSYIYISVTILDAIDKINAYEKLISDVVNILCTLNEIINLAEKNINSIEK